MNRFTGGFGSGGGTSGGSGSATPAGSDTQVQYNDAGAFGGDAGLTYVAATDTLTAGAFVSSGSTPYAEWPNYTSPAVSSASSGRIAYESATQQLRLSKNGAAYADMLSGTFTANTMAYSTGAGVLAPMAGLTWDNTNKDLTWAQGTITTSNPFVAHSATWNAAGVTFTNFDMAVTGTALADGSSFTRWILDGNTRVSVERDTAAHSVDIGLKFRNAANTANFMMGEWIATTFAPRYRGSGGLVLQAESTTASAQAFRLGLMAGGGSTYATFGGDSSGTNGMFVNQSTDAAGKWCGGRISTAANCIAIGADVYFTDEVAGSSFNLWMRAGDTQGTVDIQQWQSSAALRLSSISAVGRFHAGGNAVVAGDLALSAGWGTTATDAVTLATSRDQALVYTITSGGTGQAANATITWTFGDGTWTSVPVCMIEQSGGTGLALGQPTRSSSSATAYVWIVPGLPVAGSTYEYTMICIGT